MVGEQGRKYGIFGSDTIIPFFHAGEVEVRSPSWDYASTVMAKSAPDLRDFGLGFYTCLDDVYPLKLASAKETLVLSEYVANLEGLSYVKLELDLEWLLSIGFHRRDLNSRKWSHVLRDRCRKWLSACDVVIGVISNDKTYDTIEDFLDNGLSAEAAIAMVDAADYGKQYVFKSQTACDRLRDGFKKSTAFSKEQKDEYRNAFLSERPTYDDKAEDIRMSWLRRGGGTFFKDIIEEGLFDGRVRF